MRQGYPLLKLCGKKLARFRSFSHWSPIRWGSLGPTGRVVTHRAEPALGQHHHVQAVLRHVDTAEREYRHLRIPSLLIRARALATVRVWKKRPEHQAHSRFNIRGGCGLPVATRPKS